MELAYLRAKNFGLQTDRNHQLILVTTKLVCEQRSLTNKGRGIGLGTVSFVTISQSQSLAVHVCALQPQV